MHTSFQLLLPNFHTHEVTNILVTNPRRTHRVGRSLATPMISVLPSPLRLRGGSGGGVFFEPSFSLLRIFDIYSNDDRARACVVCRRQPTSAFFGKASLR